MRTFLLAVTLLAASPAIAAEAMKMDHSAHASAGTPSDKAYTAAMDKMMAGMTVKPTGNADRDFVSMMLPHHQGAVDMAKIELQYGTDPLLLKLARAIVESQTKEIAEMSAWQAKHGK